MTNEYTYRTLTKKDEPAVKELVKNTFKRFLGGDYWDWKYTRNPNFDPSLAVVAERNGKIVGCHHWLLRDIKITRSLTMKAVLGADLAVDPHHRKRGVSKPLLLLLRSTGIFKTKGAVISYGFIDPKLAKRLHQPLIGFIHVPTSTVAYTKLLNWKRVRRRVQEITGRLESENKLAHIIAKPNFEVGFRISGAPPLTFRIMQGKIEASEENPENADVIVKSDPATLASLKQKENRTRRLLKAFLTRKIKVQGSFLGLIRFYKNFSLFEEVFAIAS